MIKIAEKAIKRVVTFFTGRSFLFAFFLLFAVPAFAQDPEPLTYTDEQRQDTIVWSLGFLSAISIMNVVTRTLTR